MHEAIGKQASMTEREEQIRLVEEEIALAMEIVSDVKDEYEDAARRILAREQAALAELKRGMK